ncbi:hypothetical protein [Nonomuraea salmonea]|uniref:hypothetical protein n=1 Tax=Nonomuraea salmonea TaxID=46181 RepID=UPI0031EB6B51
MAGRVRRAAAGVHHGGAAAAPGGREAYEIWLVDQSDTNGLAHGGTIHIYDGHDVTRRLSDARPSDVIDLGGATSALCRASTGRDPVRPHMLVFSRRDTHAALAFVASGHVVVFDAPARRPLACFATETGAGGARQAHALWPTGDDRHLIIANQNGKKLERIRTDYATNTFTQEPAATLDLAGCTTPSGAPARPLGCARTTRRSARSSPRTTGPCSSACAAVACSSWTGAVRRWRSPGSTTPRTCPPTAAASPRRTGGCSATGAAAPRPTSTSSASSGCRAPATRPRTRRTRRPSSASTTTRRRTATRTAPWSAPRTGTSGWATGTRTWRRSSTAAPARTPAPCR